MALALVATIGMLGNTIAFAAESTNSNSVTTNIEAVSPRVTSLMSGSTHDYVTGKKTLGSFTLKRDTWGINQQLVTIAYVYEDRYHSHKARLKFKSANTEASVYLDDTAQLETTTLMLKRNETYTVTIEPECSGEYMVSVSVYY